MSLELFMNDEITQKPRMKVCNRCGTSKPATPEYFQRSHTNKDRLDGSCKPCRKEVKQEYLQHRGGKEQRQLYRKTRGNALERKRRHEKEPHRSALGSLKGSVKNQGKRKFLLPEPGTPEYEPYIEYLKTITHCPDCAKELVWYGKNNNESASFDRIDSDEDYAKENVRIVCKGCNRRKQDSPVDEWVGLLKVRVEKGILEEVDPRLLEFLCG